LALARKVTRGNDFNGSDAFLRFGDDPATISLKKGSYFCNLDFPDQSALLL
jgi:hypothetical protein